MIPNLARTVAVSACSVVLATLATNAIDMRGNFAATMLAGIFAPTQATTPCPTGMVLVTQALVPFCIDTYEASPGTGCPYEVPATSEETARNLAVSKCKPESAVGRVPWRMVSQHDAQAACARAGKRLPTSGEWYKAALGTPDQQGAWRDEDCNVARNRSDGAAETGSGIRCVSNAGAYDMVGNMWEWVEDTVVEGIYDRTSVPQTGFVHGANLDGIAHETGSAQDERFNNDRFWSDKEGTMGIMRGGYFDGKDNAGLFAVYAASPPTYSGDAVGFRCALTPTGL